ncbi:DUF262 domain-containing protein [Luteibacter sp. 9133]|uniref:DUF262 domain-containing protein n=1 Tax=Luteibacter sp. 9133 TaxID=1500891 RepID=UPI0005B8FC35|nr:DUF262 domain-containing protein [Luteibacter sp. 9133]
MKAGTLDLEKIFDGAIQYQIPLFQRPYVWDAERGWSALWEDIEDLLTRQLTTGRVHPHFLGAAVLEQLANATGAIGTRQIIDGQQRFTTLQIVMAVCRDLSRKVGNARYAERFGDLVRNRDSRIDQRDETFKLLPTNADRVAYRAVLESTSPDDLATRIRVNPTLSSSNIVGAYLYFWHQLAAWLTILIEGEDGPLPVQPSADERLDAIWTVVRSRLHLVVIDLDEQDEAQVIFETMNALGEPLLPADLIKNFLFRRAMGEGANVESLYEELWADFDDPLWRTEVKQGRLNRPRIDVFLNHYLALLTQDDVRSAHLFSAFKAFVASREKKENRIIAAPRSAAEHMAMMVRFGRIYRAFGEAGHNSRLGTFLRRLDAVDTTTVYPFLLLAHDALMPDNEAEFNSVLGVLESFLIRRMVCGLTTKNYNRLFIDLTKAVARSGVVLATDVAAWLSRSSAESQKFPTDAEFVDAVLSRPVYDQMANYKVRAVLEAVDGALDHAKSERLPLPVNLTIEHVMPRSWTTHWPLEDLSMDAAAAQDARLRRSQLLHSFGNLTLITDALNPSLSNGAWETKRPELLKFSRLNLTRYFFDDVHAKVWNEAAISRRGAILAEVMRGIWPDVERRGTDVP